MKKLAQIQDFVKNMYKAAAGLASGELEVLEAKEKARRLAICASCEHFNQQRYQCKVCSCKGGMLKIKASVNLWKCPKGKWEHTPNLIENELGYCKSCKAPIVKIIKKDGKVFEQCSNDCIISSDEH